MGWQNTWWIVPSGAAHVFKTRRPIPHYFGTDFCNNFASFTAFFSAFHFAFRAAIPARSSGVLERKLRTFTTCSEFHISQHERASK